MAGARWYECLISILWLYERRPEKWLLDLAHILKISGTDFASAGRLWKKIDKNWTMYAHVVNAVMSLKAGPLYRRVMQKKNVSVGDTDAERMFRILTKYHGTAVGHFTGDECLAGTSPIHGTELCGVAEAMYSYEWLMALTGKSVWADRAEMLAFNALPAAISPDMWTHQYDQLSNQIACCVQNDPPVFNTNSSEANIFGLEPNFGCCTANFNQAWPKFAISAFMKEGKDTLVSAMLVPAGVTVALNGTNIHVELDTQYPFRNKLTYKVEAETEFTLKIRIPSWVKSFTINGQEQRAESGWYMIRKAWRGKEAVEVDFAAEIERLPRRRGLFVLKRGALIYSLAIEEQWIQREYERDGVVRQYPYCDYEIIPQSKWNYAFCSDNFRVQENVFDAPFSTKHPPVEIEAEMCEIDWGFAPGQDGVCRETSKKRVPISNPQKKRFIPYGCTQLRMTEMPFIERHEGCLGLQERR